MADDDEMDTFLGLKRVNHISKLGLTSEDVGKLTQLITDWNAEGRSAADCHDQYKQQVSELLSAHSLTLQDVLDQHSDFPHIAATQSLERFEQLWQEACSCAAGKGHQQGGLEQQDEMAWNAPQAEGEADDEDHYE